MTTQSETSNSKAPISKLRIGLVSASIWQRIVDENFFYSVTFERRYRDAEGVWQSTTNFDAEDLLVLAKLADQCHTEIMNLRYGTRA